jgi:hypothetical protein
MSSRKRPLGVDVGPEQRAQAAPLVLTHPVMELGRFQNGLHEQGVGVFSELVNDLHWGASS